MKERREGREGKGERKAGRACEWGREEEIKSTTLKRGVWLQGGESAGELSLDEVCERISSRILVICFLRFKGRWKGEYN